MSEEQFYHESCVRGYHVYKDIWTPSLGEELICQPQFGNVHDVYAVAVLRRFSTNLEAVGHAPRKISASFHLFLRRGGVIACQVTGSRRYSADLINGGLEIPCRYIISGAKKEIDKLKSLLLPSTSCSSLALSLPPPTKKAKVTDVIELSDGEDDDDDDFLLSTIWLEFQGHFITEADRKIITEGYRLNDCHINFAQQLIRNQFPTVQGLRHTLLLQKDIKNKDSKIQHGVQIIFDRDNHWLVASNMGGDSKDVVSIYDSVYYNINSKTKETVIQVFGEECSIKMVPFQKQDGCNDCGLFAIAVVTAIVNNIDIFTVLFDQSKMRDHLLNCLTMHHLSLFPVIPATQS